MTFRFPDLRGKRIVAEHTDQCNALRAEAEFDATGLCFGGGCTYHLVDVDPPEPKPVTEFHVPLLEDEDGAPLPEAVQLAHRTALAEAWENGHEVCEWPNCQRDHHNPYEDPR